SRHQPDLGALLATESRDSNLTYFDFVNGQLAAPPPAAATRTGRRTGKKQPAPTPPLVPLPQELAGRYRLARLLRGGGNGLGCRDPAALGEELSEPPPRVAAKRLQQAAAPAAQGNRQAVRQRAPLP
ncbi:hypothetical protein QV12_00045, partial [Pseudomonas putida]